MANDYFEVLTRIRSASYSGMHMEDSTPQPKPNKDNAIVFYILGGVIITAIIVAAFLLYPRNPQNPPTSNTEPVLGQTATAPTAVPVVKGPIGSLACTEQFYNTVNGVSQTYYLSANGEAPTAAGSVTCTMTVSVNNQVVATNVITPMTSPETDRGGFTFKCTSPGVKLKPGVATKVSYDMKDANGVTATCSRTFLLP
jgi:hypothetical protein